MAEFAIGHRMVGDGHPPLVVAEIGVNHNGSVPVALQMIAAAASAGAECVKFQCHIPDAEMVPDAMPTHVAETIRRCALSERDERTLQGFAHELGLIYLSTPFSIEAADRLQAMDVPAFKIGSGELTNLPLLEHVASFGKPVILSTGMGTRDEIEAATNVLGKQYSGGAVLHCTSTYPTKPGDVRLGIMQQVRYAGMGDWVSGLSDHSRGIAVALGAVALGAEIIEKHFTLDHAQPCPDAAVSIDPAELRQLVAGAREVWEATRDLHRDHDLHMFERPVLPAESAVAQWARHSVTLAQPVSAGEPLTTMHLTTKRPGRGIPASRLYECIGRKVTRDLPANAQLQDGDLA